MFERKFNNIMGLNTNYDDRIKTVIKNILLEQEYENTKIVPSKSEDEDFDVITCEWYQNNEKVGVMDFLLNYPKSQIKTNLGNFAFIYRYQKINKFDKSVDGFSFIKKCIDYMLNLNYSIISVKGTRSPGGDKMWEKLDREYVIVEHPKSYRTANRKYLNIQQIISKKT